MDYHCKWSNIQVTKATLVFYLINQFIMADIIITKKGETAHFEAHIKMYTYKVKQRKNQTKNLIKMDLRLENQILPTKA